MNVSRDLSKLDRLIESGRVDPAATVALIGKTEGNGAHNFTRDLIAPASSAVRRRRSAGASPSCGRATSVSGAFRIGDAVLTDAIDADRVSATLHDAGRPFDVNPTRDDAAHIVAAVPMAEVSATGPSRSRRNTRLPDADFSDERHARVALGAVIASVTGDPAIFVPGGAGDQRATGVAPIATAVRV